MKNKILTGLLLVLIGGWGSLSAQSAGSNYARSEERPCRERV